MTPTRRVRPGVARRVRLARRLRPEPVAGTDAFTESAQLASSRARGAGSTIAPMSVIELSRPDTMAFGQPPDVDIVVPVYNEVDQIESSVRALHSFV